MSPSTIVHFARGDRRLEILPASASQVVEDDDLLEALGDQSIGDVRANQPRSAGNQRSLVIHCSIRPSILLAWLPTEGL